LISAESRLTSSITLKHCWRSLGGFLCQALDQLACCVECWLADACCCGDERGEVLQIWVFECRDCRKTVKKYFKMLAHRSLEPRATLVK
jgi:hypothetical protein